MSHPLVVNVRRSSCDVFVGRPSIWGNPFHIGKDGNREDVVAKHRKWLLEEQPTLLARIGELKGKSLGCYCAPLACHADTLAELAERTS